ncbi:MAG: carbohydrate ABC transporter permease [Bacteroidota bacterium]
MRRKSIQQLLIEGFGILLSGVVLIPLYFIVINSFKTKNEAADMLLTFPKKLQIVENYQRVFVEGKILSAFINSLTITLIAVAFIILFSAMIGFILQRRKGKFTNLVNFLLIAGLIVPPAIVPIFWVLQQIHLQSSFTGVILIYITFGLSFSAMLYKSFFTTVPQEIDEAAIIDGCNITALFFRVIFPIVKPVTFTVFIVQFLSVWNNFDIALYFLSSPTKFTMPLTVYFFFGQYNSYWNLVFADVVLIALPVVIVYFIAQKHVISGMTSGAIKG